MKGGLIWRNVVVRVTADAVNGEIFDPELVRDIKKSLEHTPLEGGPRDIQTILVLHRFSTTMVGEEESDNMECRMTGTLVTLDPISLVSGPCCSLFVLSIVCSLVPSNSRCILVC